MTQLSNLVRRNCKLFFKDKGLFFTSLITPMILLVLYATFLANVYRDAFLAGLGDAIVLPEKLLNAAVNGQLVSSLLAVSCVTVAFCSNMLMVQDKVTGARKDLAMTPVTDATLSLSYYIATLISTLLVCLAAAGACFVYIAATGWYLSFGDVALVLLDVILLVMFGTALSSIINLFLSTQGQISAVGSIVSSMYGFISGAYMPISQLGDGLQKAISLLPGTYGTSLLRNHAMAGAFREMETMGLPQVALDGLRDAVDCNLYFFGTQVSQGTMFAILSCAIGILMGVYILLTVSLKKRSN